MNLSIRLLSSAALLITAAVNLSIALRAQAGGDAAFETIAEVVAAKMHAYHVPGVAIGVLRDGRVTTRAFGETSVDHPLAITADTIFPLASISKTVTTTAMMRLIEQGRIELRAPVRRYLPDFRVQDEEASRDVTIWHLLTHTSGWEGQLSASEFGEDTLKRFVAGLSTNMQLAPPGTAWSYNNAGFGVAGRVIEVVTGTTIGDAFNDLVFKPLGLATASTRVGDVVTQRFALGHRVGMDGTRTIVRPFTMGSTTPAGGVAMSMTDLMSYARFHLGDGTSATGTRMLSRAMLHQMQAPQLRKHATDDEMGLGWQLRTVGNVRMAAHGGTFAGHILLLELVPEQNFALAILTNAGSGWRLIQDVERAALREYHHANFQTNQAIAHRGLNETLPVATPLAEQPDAAPYLGKYVRPMNAVIVRRERGQLIVQVHPNKGNPDPDMPVAFYGADRAVVTSGSEQGASIEFVRNALGVVEWIRVTGRIARRMK